MKVRIYYRLKNWIRKEYNRISYKAREATLHALRRDFRFIREVQAARRRIRSVTNNLNWSDYANGQAIDKYQAAIEVVTKYDIKTRNYIAGISCERIAIVI